MISSMWMPSWQMLKPGNQFSENVPSVSLQSPTALLLPLGMGKVNNHLKPPEKLLYFKFLVKINGKVRQKYSRWPRIVQYLAVLASCQSLVTAP